jgi:hypothetical protein
MSAFLVENIVISKIIAEVEKSIRGSEWFKREMVKSCRLTFLIHNGKHALVSKCLISINRLFVIAMVIQNKAWSIRFVIPQAQEYMH